MAQLFSVHPTDPQARLIDRAAALVRAGAVIAYPTDSCYALGCHLGDKAAVDRIRAIRRFEPQHHLTLVCHDLKEIAKYALVDNQQYRLLKSATPGSYTFILRATREVPRRLLHPKRSTIGVRVPDHVVTQALLQSLGEPLLSATLSVPGHPEPLTDAQEIRDHLEKQLDLIIDAGACGREPTTVVDLTGETPALIRAGRGDPAVFGFSPRAH